MKETPRIIEARRLSHEGHDAINQKRKWTGLPYWTHTDEVAEIVSTVTDDEDMIVAAFFHDFREDLTPLLPTVYNEKWFLDNLGTRAYEMVIDLSDVFTKESYPNYNRKQRKNLEAKRLGTISNDSKTVKISDLISNSSDIVQNDPGFAVTYIKEKLTILPYLVGGNEILWERANKIAQEAAKTLHIT